MPFNNPTPRAPNGLPREAARGFAPQGWSVIIDRFYDVFEFLQVKYEGQLGCVVDIFVGEGMLGMGVEASNVEVGQLLLETWNAARTTCEVCGKAGIECRVSNWEKENGKVCVAILCPEDIRAAQELGVAFHNYDTLSLPWSEDPLRDRKWYPGKDEEDDKLDGTDKEDGGEQCL